MAVKDKVLNALRDPLGASYVRIEDDDGISGYVVSPKIEGMSTLDRQSLIDEALEHAPDPLTAQERRHVLMIAGLTPSEYDAVGPRVRVHRIRDMGAGTFEILLHGGPSDATFVKEIVDGLEGVTTTQPTSEPGAAGILMTFRVRGSTERPLTKSQILEALRGDQYVEVMPNA